MLKIEFDRLGYNYKIPQLCTVNLSKKLIPAMDSYKLGNLVKSLGISISNRHRASGDALATVELFKILLVKDIDKKIINKLIIKDYTIIKNKWIDLLKNLAFSTGIHSSSFPQRIWVGAVINFNLLVWSTGFEFERLINDSLLFSLNIKSL